MEKRYFVYIIRCADGTLYTGYTTNVERRVETHNAGKGGHYTRAHRPVVLAASWTFATKQEAMRAEYALKRLPRAEKMRLIVSNTPLPFTFDQGSKATQALVSPEDE